MNQQSPRPSQQGQLDNLCGIYSLVNAIAYFYDGQVRRRKLKIALMRAWAKRWSLEPLIRHGMDGEELEYLVETVLMQGYYHDRYPIHVTKPFVGRRHLRSVVMLQEMQAFLESGYMPGTRLVLIGTVDHWSLIKRMDSMYVYFFDSAGSKRAFRASYSLRPGPKPYLLIPSCIFFLSRAEEV